MKNDLKPQFSEDQISDIADRLATSGYCVLTDGLAADLARALRQRAFAFDAPARKPAGVGRGAGHFNSEAIRSDTIRWIEGDNDSERAWLSLMDSLRTGLNRHLFMGLFSFESHFAHYAPGAFYEKHVDAFQGQSNRVLSCVAYLNHEWQSDWGGALLLYDADGVNVLEQVVPRSGTLVLFLSEDFPHEVQPASHERHSVAGWFRVNSSSGRHIDPPG